MNSKVQIEGNVDVAVNAECGSSVNVNIDNRKIVDYELNRSVHVLLKACAQHDTKETIETISQLFFETTVFKKLNLDQLSKLQIIAEDLNNKISQANAKKACYSTIISEQQFFDLTGIRASAPARDAMMMLLDEDVTSKQISSVWKNNLNFKDGQLELISPKLAPVIAAFCLVGIGLCVLLAMSAAPLMFEKGELVNWTKLAAFAAAEIMTLSGAAYFAWVGGSAMRPYHIVKAIKGCVEKVNLRLQIERKV